MSDQSQVDDIIRQHMAGCGRKGGKTMTPARRTALAKARVAKEFYKRHPDMRPKREGQS